MAEKGTTKKIKTPDGTVLYYYYEEGKNPKLHSFDSPAIKYPKEAKKKDIYAIYGREMSKREWTIYKSEQKVTSTLPDYF